ncbi:protein phosphatase 2C domain-containing protein [Streptomyces mirabilis]|uniref:PP2C family serine/threonine-protein phosphatase n=3 Tax=Streptomyces mirabilis TaxID=68239 RepID=A0ABU3UI83_9ACTN|nr:MULTISPECIES: PP2C family serine/threonine-protein phosphatase [Streptomyces]MCX4612663.1 protein phosphatase 2C domain-containing protein [Streptomyces mirabilis]MCX5352890.1 protein phosphatase 2C domain-containing protein [Streptomyces mirabilis]MDU8993633.1 PP2C family serine/threonine-protein phosphatase [Streptomyces mirabilis]
MSQQGERPTGHEDDWWGQLYDATGDTGPTPAADSLDDRFASAAGTVGSGSEPPEPEGPPVVPEQRGGGATPRGEAPGRRPARWDREPRSDPPDRFLDPTGPAEDLPPSTSADAAPDPSEIEDAVPSGSGEGVGRPGSGEGLGPSGSGEDPGPLWSGGGRGSSRSGGDFDLPGDGPGDGEGSGFSRGGADPGLSWSSGYPGPSGSGEDPGLSSADAEPGPWWSREATGFSRGGADPRSSGGGEEPLPPWGPPPAEPPTPATFPPGPTPPGFHAESLRGRTPKESPGAAVPPRPTAPPHPAPPGAAASEDALPEPVLTVPHQPPPVDHVGSGPPTYDAEPTALPPADPDDLDDLVADTVLDGARYGASTLRAASVRGDSARFRGEPRRDSLLTARFGAGEHALVLVAMATGARATPGAHRAAAEACRWIGRAVGRSHARLAEDIRAARRGDLKSGLHRLTDRSLGKLRASAAEQGIEPEEYTAGLRCLLLTGDPECRTRVFFGVGDGGLFRLRDGEWQDIEPRVAETTGEAVVGFGSLPHETPEGDRLTMDLGITTPPSPYEPAPEPPREPFRFRASVARPGDTLLLCTGGLAEPLRGEPQLCEHLTERWSAAEPPGLAAFLADTQVRVKGYADDRTVAAVWEA